MSSTHPLTPWRILLAVDGSNHGLTAAALLHDLPWPPGSEVTLLAVVPTHVTSFHETMPAALATVRDIVQAEHLTVHEELLEGHPAEQLTTYADAHQPDLLVVGAQGLRATLGILLGGVAQQVVEYAECPVLVVRAGLATRG